MHEQESNMPKKFQQGDRVRVATAGFPDFVGTVKTDWSVITPTEGECFEIELDENQVESGVYMVPVNELTPLTN